mgnify:CR=1 FL=1
MHEEFNVILPFNERKPILFVKGHERLVAAVELLASSARTSIYGAFRLGRSHCQVDGTARGILVHNVSHKTTTGALPALVPMCTKSV